LSTDEERSGYGRPITSPMTREVIAEHRRLAHEALHRELLGGHNAEWFNDDANYRDAVGCVLMAKDSLTRSGGIPFTRLFGGDGLRSLPEGLLEGSFTGTQWNRMPASLLALQAVAPGRDFLLLPTEAHLGATRLLTCASGVVKDRLSLTDGLLLPLVTDPEVVHVTASIVNSTPIDLSVLPLLEEIDLKYCDKLTELPPSISLCTHLSRLCLGYCKSLTHLPPSLAKLPKLRELNCTLCDGLTRQGLPTLPQAGHGLTLWPERERIIQPRVVTKWSDDGFKQPA
jgi:hypothetical protein